jgi:hypothetical protein
MIFMGFRKQVTMKEIIQVLINWLEGWVPFIQLGGEAEP